MPPKPIQFKTMFATILYKLKQYCMGYNNSIKKFTIHMTLAHSLSQASEKLTQ